MRKAILSLMVAITLMAPFCCYGYDAMYVDVPETWIDNDDVSSLNIEDDNLDGFLQYYIDSESYTFYGHISHGYFIDNSVPVFVGVESTYANVEFDDNGYKDEDFKAGLSYSNNRNEIYFAVDFRNKDIRNNTDFVRVTIRIDGEVYLVCEKLAIDIKDPVKTTVPKTTKASNSKTEKETTAKSSGGSSVKKETTTKFKYTLDKSDLGEMATDELVDDVASGTIILTDDSDEPENHLSAVSVALLIIAVLLITVGAVLIINSHLKSKNSADDVSDDNEENDAVDEEIIEEDPDADYMRKINIGKDLSDYDLDDLDE